MEGAGIYQGYIKASEQRLINKSQRDPLVFEKDKLRNTQIKQTKSQL